MIRGVFIADVLEPTEVAVRAMLFEMRDERIAERLGADEPAVASMDHVVGREFHGEAFDGLSARGTRSNGVKG